MTVLADTRAILLVEDNAADAGLAVEELRASDHAPDVRVAKDGDDALAQLRAHGDGTVRRPDVVVLDLNLPRQGGLATLAELKSDAELRRIPVIVLTTSKSQDEINRCYELGAAAVLNKPLRLSDYRAMLSALDRFWIGHVRFPDGC